MTTSEINALRRVYGDICRGYSEVTLRGQPIYLAHLTTFDQAEIDEVYERALADARAKGIKTEAERLKYLEANKIWTPKDERDLAMQRVYLDNLRLSRTKYFIKAQIDAADKTIAEETKKVNEVVSKRARLIGLTAEHVAEQRVQPEYIRVTFYEDADLTRRHFTRADMDRLDDSDTDELLDLYVFSANRMTTNALRKIAIQPFFVNQFYLCGERLYDFFGVPLVDLTIYQANLLSYGKYFRDIFSQHKIDKALMDDPDKIEEFVTRSTNAKKAVDKVSQDGGRVGIVGGSAEDLGMMGVEDGTKTMQDAIVKGHKDGRSAAKDLGYTEK